MQEVVIIEKYFEKQLKLMDYSKLLEVNCGRSKTSTGSYSSTSGDMYNYLQFAQVVENFMLTEREAEELLQALKSISKDSVALPSSYKAVKSSIMPGLQDR